MARADVHGRVLVAVERTCRDERRALVRETVHIMQDGAVLMCTTKTGDRDDMSTWIPSGRQGAMLNSSWSSGWKLVTRTKLPELACTEEVAQWILEHPARAAACRTAAELARMVRAHQVEHQTSAAIAKAWSLPVALPPEDAEVNRRADTLVLTETKQAVTPASMRPRAVTSPENGRKGGRPSKWSPRVLALAARAVRLQAKTARPEDREELLRLAQALGDGTFRSRAKV